MVKNLPATQETRVRSLGGKDPLEKEMATNSSILAWTIPHKRAWQAIVHGVAKTQTRLSPKAQLAMSLSTNSPRLSHQPSPGISEIF